MIRPDHFCGCMLTFVLESPLGDSCPWLAMQLQGPMEGTIETNQCHCNPPTISKIERFEIERRFCEPRGLDYPRDCCFDWTWARIGTWPWFATLQLVMKVQGFSRQPHGNYFFDAILNDGFDGLGQEHCQRRPSMCKGWLFN